MHDNRCRQDHSSSQAGHLLAGTKREASDELEQNFQDFRLEKLERMIEVLAGSKKDDLVGFFLAILGSGATSLGCKMLACLTSNFPLGVGIMGL